MRPRAIVRLNRMPLQNRGWRRERERCEACGGSGTRPRARNRFKVGICRACKGWGFRLAWKRAEAVPQERLFG